MKNKYGQKEALSRLKAGNMKWRQSPTDGRFMEFGDVDEKVITDKKKTNTAQLHAKGKAIKADEWMKYDSMVLDDVELEGLGQVNDKALENMEPELQQVRDFSKVAVQLAENYSKTFEQKHRLEACKKLDAMYEMSQLKDYKWTENNSVKFEKAVEALLGHYSWLP
eukprot:s2405_g6.t1